MTGLIDWLTAQITSNPLLISAVVLLLAASESLIIVGSFVPGTTILLALAATAGAIGHGLWWMFGAATLGAILGDGVSFWIGQRYGHQIAKWGPIKRRPELLESSEAYFRKRGAMSVAVARFIPGIRSVVPAAAGMLRMPPAHFLAANVASAIVWAALHIFGTGITAGVLASVGGWTAALLVAVIVILGILVWLAYMIALFSLPYVRGAQHGLHRWASRREDPTLRLLTRPLAPDDPTGLLMLLWTSALLGALLVFADLSRDVREGGAIAQMDLTVSYLLQTLRSPELDRVMVFITMLGDTVVLGAIALAVIAWLAFRRHFGMAVAFAAATLIPLAVVPVASTVLGQVEPMSALYPSLETFGVPSAHATNAAVLMALLAIVIGGALEGAARWTVTTVLLAFPALIAFSRIYLQVHSPSNVLAGLLFATAIAAGFLLGFGEIRRQDFKPAGVAAVALLAALLVGGIHVATGYSQAAGEYPPRDLSIAIDETEWRGGDWHDGMPDGMRIDKQRFFLEWVGDRAPFQALMRERGWQPAASPWNFAALGHVFSSSTRLAALPPLPELHLGRSASEVWLKPDASGEGRLIFRLWPSQFTVGGQRLYVGAMEGERLEHPLGLLTVIDDRAAEPEAVDAIVQALRTDPDTKDSAMVVR